MKIINILFLSVFTSQLHANELTDKTWLNNLKAQGIDSDDQAYCYTNEKGKNEGKNISKKIRLASTSKILVSLWSIDKLGSNYKFDTKLFIKNGQLFIKGSYDPFLSNEKMFFMLSQLNEMGIKHFDKITFDKNLMVFPDAPYLIDEHPNMTRANHVKLLKKYFNTNDWTQDFKDEYANFKYLAKENMYLPKVEFTVDEVEFVEKNPFEGVSDVKELTLSSPPLYKYLKEMNVKSNNYVSETIFRMLGNGLGFEKYQASKLNVDTEKMKLWTGSGLPYFNEDGLRLDNYSSCEIILDALKILKDTAESQGKEIEDILAVPGSDKGTFKNRIFPEDFKNSFVAKTGTLMHTSALAGAMNTQKGFSFFGIFNQSTDIQGSKAVQNEMVKSIMLNALGGPKSFEYVVEPFHTYSGDKLKSLDIFEKNNFSSINGKLK